MLQGKGETRSATERAERRNAAVLVFLAYMQVFGYEQLAKPFCASEQHTLPLDSTLAAGYPCGGSQWERIRYLALRPHMVYLDYLRLQPQDCWVSASTACMLARVLLGLVLPRSSRWRALYPTQRLVGPLTLLVWLLLSDQEPSALAVWFMRSWPLLDCAYILVFPTSILLESIYGALSLLISATIGLRIRARHPHLHYSLPAQLLICVASTAWILYVHSWRWKAAPRRRGAAALDDVAAAKWQRFDEAGCSHARDGGSGSGAGGSGSGGDCNSLGEGSGKAVGSDSTAAEKVKGEAAAGRHGAGAKAGVEVAPVVDVDAATKTNVEPSPRPAQSVAAAAGACTDAAAVSSPSSAAAAEPCAGAADAPSGLPAAAAATTSNPLHRRYRRVGAAAAPAAVLAHSLPAQLSSGAIQNGGLSDGSSDAAQLQPAAGPTDASGASGTAPVHLYSSSLRLCPHPLPVTPTNATGPSAGAASAVAQDGAAGTGAANAAAAALASPFIARIASAATSGAARAGAAAASTVPHRAYTRVVFMKRLQLKIRGADPEQVAAGYRQRLADLMAESGYQLEGVYLRRGCIELVVDLRAWQAAAAEPESQPQPRHQHPREQQPPQHQQRPLLRLSLSTSDTPTLAPAAGFAGADDARQQSGASNSRSSGGGGDGGGGGTCSVHRPGGAWAPAPAVSRISDGTGLGHRRRNLNGSFVVVDVRSATTATVPTASLSLMPSAVLLPLEASPKGTELSQACQSPRAMAAAVSWSLPPHPPSSAPPSSVTGACSGTCDIDIGLLIRALQLSDGGDESDEYDPPRDATPAPDTGGRDDGGSGDGRGGADVRDALLAGGSAVDDVVGEVLASRPDLMDVQSGDDGGGGQSGGIAAAAAAAAAPAQELAGVHESEAEPASMPHWVSAPRILSVFPRVLTAAAPVGGSELAGASASGPTAASDAGAGLGAGGSGDGGGDDTRRPRDARRRRGGGAAAAASALPPGFIPGPFRFEVIVWWPDVALGQRESDLAADAAPGHVVTARAAREPQRPPAAPAAAPAPGGTGPRPAAPPSRPRNHLEMLFRSQGFDLPARMLSATPLATLTAAAAAAAATHHPSWTPEGDSAPGAAAADPGAAEAAAASQSGTALCYVLEVPYVPGRPGLLLADAVGLEIVPLVVMGRHETAAAAAELQTAVDEWHGSPEELDDLLYDVATYVQEAAEAAEEVAARPARHGGAGGGAPTAGAEPWTASRGVLPLSPRAASLGSHLLAYALQNGWDAFSAMLRSHLLAAAGISPGPPPEPATATESRTQPPSAEPPPAAVASFAAAAGLAGIPAAGPGGRDGGGSGGAVEGGVGVGAQGAWAVGEHYDCCGLPDAPPPQPAHGNARRRVLQGAVDARGLAAAGNARGPPSPSAVRAPSVAPASSHTGSINSSLGNSSIYSSGGDSFVWRRGGGGGSADCAGEPLAGPDVQAGGDEMQSPPSSASVPAPSDERPGSGPGPGSWKCAAAGASRPSWRCFAVHSLRWLPALLVAVLLWRTTCSSSSPAAHTRPAPPADASGYGAGGGVATGGVSWAVWLVLPLLAVLAFAGVRIAPLRQACCGLAQPLLLCRRGRPRPPSRGA